MQSFDERWRTAAKCVSHPCLELLEIANRQVNRFVTVEVGSKEAISLGFADRSCQTCRSEFQPSDIGTRMCTSIR